MSWRLVQAPVQRAPHGLTICVLVAGIGPFLTYNVPLCALFAAVSPTFRAWCFPIRRIPPPRTPWRILAVLGAVACRPRAATPVRTQRVRRTLCDGAHAQRCPLSQAPLAQWKCPSVDTRPPWTPSCTCPTARWAASARRSCERCTLKPGRPAPAPPPPRQGRRAALPLRCVLQVRPASAPACRRAVCDHAVCTAAAAKVPDARACPQTRGRVTAPACGRLEGLAASEGLRLPEAAAGASWDPWRGAPTPYAALRNVVSLWLAGADAEQVFEAWKALAWRWPHPVERRPSRWLLPGDDGGGAGQPSGRAAGRPQPRAADGLARPPTDSDAWEPAAVLVSRAAAQAEDRGRQSDAGAGRSRPPGTGGGGGRREAGGWDAPDGREDGPVAGGGADPQGGPPGAWASEGAWSTHEDARDEGGGPAADARGGEPGAAPATSYERRWAAGLRRTRTQRGGACDTCARVPRCGPACRCAAAAAHVGRMACSPVLWCRTGGGVTSLGRQPAGVRLRGGRQARTAGGAARAAGEARAARRRRRPAG